MSVIGGFRSDLSITRKTQLTEVLETFPRVFCFPKSHINENGGKPCLTGGKSRLPSKFGPFIGLKGICRGGGRAGFPRHLL